MDINFDRLVQEFYDAKTKADQYASIAKDQNIKIKDQLISSGIRDYSVDDISVKLVEQANNSLDEVMLLSILKAEGNEALTAIKTREYVDTEILEDLIYRGVVKADIVDTCIKKKAPTYKLFVRRK